MQEKILVVDDELLIRQTLVRKLSREGYEVTSASDGYQARKLMSPNHWDLVILDITMPGPDGLTLLREFLQEEPDLPVIMLTGNHQIGVVVEAIKAGAFQYITKPFELEEVVEVVHKALHEHALELEEKLEPKESIKKKTFGFDRIIGDSHAIRQVRELAMRVAKSQAETILLLGESGTGKNLLAQAIHYQSARAAGPFTEITCTAISETLLESELFGHERGAFTDAHQTRQGLAELANGGTLFLDEIGDMPLSIQAKLLGFLESRKFRRVGGKRDIHVDVRIIAATNADLREKVKEKLFRPDLFFRLNVIEIKLGPLREHTEDIGLLAKSFINHFNQKFRRQIRGLTPEALAILNRYSWPGNARELRNQIERAMILCQGDTIGPGDLSISGWDDLHGSSDPSQLPPDGVDLETLEDHLVQQAMDRADGNQTHAAKLLGLTRDQLRYRLKKKRSPESSSV